MADTILYTDGSCLQNPGPGGWGCVLLVGDKETHLSGGEPNTTNNRMELMALIKGLQALEQPQAVEVYTDSQYIVNAFNKGWLNNWQRNGWQSTSGDVKNVDLWEEILRLTAIHRCTFTWVKGHASNKYNNLCDELARKAATKFLKGTYKESMDMPPVEASYQQMQLGELNAAEGEQPVSSEEQTVPVKDYLAVLYALDSILKKKSQIRYETERPCGVYDFCECCCDDQHHDYMCAYALSQFLQGKGAVPK